eukprot:2921743-Pyramimonas_sp.AAC.1
MRAPTPADINRRYRRVEQPGDRACADCLGSSRSSNSLALYWVGESVSLLWIVLRVPLGVAANPDTWRRKLFCGWRHGVPVCPGTGTSS